MRAILDEATDPWGIKVTRVELKNILPPQDIQNSMEKQMKAERDRRQAILQAEGTKRSQILVAEGEKESAILRADAEKQSAILRAQGQAEAILAVQKATAEAMQMLNDACPNDQVIKLKALEAMQKVADGKATKIIIPSELQGLAGLAAGLVETVREPSSKENRRPALFRAGRFCRKKTTGPAGGYDWKGGALCPENPARCGGSCSLRWQFILSAPLLPCRS